MSDFVRKTSNYMLSFKDNGYSYDIIWRHFYRYCTSLKYNKKLGSKLNAIRLVKQHIVRKNSFHK